MKKTIINYQVGENKISFSQTSKGYWYCSELSIYCKDIFDGIGLMDGAVDAVDQVLKERNKTNIQEVKE